MIVNQDGVHTVPKTPMTQKIVGPRRKKIKVTEMETKYNGHVTTITQDGVHIAVKTTIIQ